MLSSKKNIIPQKMSYYTSTGPMSLSSKIIFQTGFSASKWSSARETGTPRAMQHSRMPMQKET